MTSLGTFIEIFLQALIAGVLIGAIYGLMCVGLGIIFGVMRVINFAQGEFLMLGMYFTFYLVVGFNMLWFLGPIVGPYTGALLAGPALFAVAYVLSPLPDFARNRHQRRRNRRRRPLRAAHSHPRRRARPAERRPHPVWLHASIGAHARCPRAPGKSRCFMMRTRRCSSTRQGPSLASCRSWSRPRCIGSSIARGSEDAARGGRQRFGRNLHGHRRRSRLPHRIWHRHRHHRYRRWPGRHLQSVPALYRSRLRHHHVCGRGARRHGQHSRRVLGRT